MIFILPRLAQPPRDMLRFHRLLNDADELLFQLAQAYLKVTNGYLDVGQSWRIAWRRCQFSANRLKKIFCWGCWRMRSSSSFTPNPGPCGSAKYPSWTSGLPGAVGFTHSSAKSLKCSRILKFGVDAAKC